MRFSIPSCTLLLSLASAPLYSQSATNAYVRHNLIADQAAVGADQVDTGLINAWGVAFSATGPFWLSATGTGLSTVYSSSATSTITISTLRVTVPPAPSSGAMNGSPTGIVVSPANFPIQGKNTSFIFDTLDGTISGWANALNPTAAVIAVDNSSSGAIYTGLAVGGTTANPWLYAANFHSGAVEIYDVNYKLVAMPGAFIDAMIPAGYAPFNIWPLNGKLYVTYTQQDAAKKNYLTGAGIGYVDAFDMNGVLLQRVTSGGALNAPWGVAIAPPSFGTFSNKLLVGNFGDGKINAYDPTTGGYLGVLQDSTGTPIAIPGLWALIQGNGRSSGDSNAIYFAAGGGNQQHGVLGSLQAAPAVSASGVVNAASSLPGSAPNTILSIFGANLASTSRNWATKDFNNNALPTTVDGVGVTINGKPAYVTYVSPTQVNVLAPQDTTTGPVPIVVTNNGLTSASATMTLSATAPAFFSFGKNAIAALHADNTPVGATGLITGSTPAKAGETIVLYATGLGPTNPAYPVGQLITQPYPLAGTPTVTFGSTQATVSFAGLVAAGLYQINVTVPASTPSGDTPVICTLNGASTQSGAIITVQ